MTVFFFQYLFKVTNSFNNPVIYTMDDEVKNLVSIGEIF